MTQHFPMIDYRLANAAPELEVRNLSLWYESKKALEDVSFDLHPSELLAFIGPSGCGKSTALKCLNWMHDDTPGVRIEGEILFRQKDAYARDVDPPEYRRHFGWVAQKPNPFPATIYRNVSYGPQIHGLTSGKADLDELVESCLRQAHLWDELKDVLHKKDGTELSGGQQQRLCVARALSTKPEILLMDEPTGSIDPIATAKLEELMISLKQDHAIVVITHSMMEARRVADRVAYFHLGNLLEIGPTEQMFTAAQTREARSFIAGKFG